MSLDFLGDASGDEPLRGRRAASAVNLDLVIARAAPPSERIMGGVFGRISTSPRSRAQRKSRLISAFGNVAQLTAHAESLGLTLEGWLQRFDDVRLCGPEPEWATAFRQIYERLGTDRFPFSEFRRFARAQIRKICPDNLRLTADATDGPLDYLDSRLSMPLYPTVSVDARLGRQLDWAKRFESSPVLAYVLGKIFVDWLADMRRLLRLAASDQFTIARSFFSCDDPGALCRIECGLGDPHMGGRSVAILRFERGTVVFKPKDMRVAQAVGDVASQIQAVPLARPFLVLGDGYAWERFHQSRALANAPEADSFYRSLGGWLFLLHAMGATDFWFDNLIADGATPRFVDFETAVQPFGGWPEGAVRPLVGRGKHRIEGSPGAVGILPLQLATRQGGDPIDIGCFTFPGTFVAPLPDFGASGLNSLKVVQYAPHYNDGTFADVTQHFDAFKEGYLGVARELEQHRTQASILQSLRKRPRARVRIIPSDTWTMYRVLYRSLYPCYIADAIWREIELHHTIPYRRDLIGPIRESTVRDLRQLDVPYFSTCVDSLDLFGADGEKIERYYSQGAIEATRDRLASLANVDDDNRVALLRSNLSIRRDNPPRFHASLCTGAAASSANLLEWANGMADRVIDLVVTNDRGAPTWIGLYQDVFSGVRFVSPMGFDVLSGRAGIGLALFRIGDALERTDLVTLACEVLATTAHECMNAQAFFLASGAGFGVGAAGLVVALSQVPDLTPLANELYEIAQSNKIWLTSGSDLISGLEGWRFAAEAIARPAPRAHGKERHYAPSVRPRLACWMNRRQSLIHNIDGVRAASMRRDFERYSTWFAESWLDDRHNMSGTDGVPALAVRFSQLAVQDSDGYSSRGWGALWPPATLCGSQRMHKGGIC